MVDLTEWLDWGPIATGNFQDRANWLDRNVPDGIAAWDWIPDAVARFQEGVATDPDRLIWIAPLSAQEQAGLYWYFDQFGGTGARIIVADHPLPGAWQNQPPFSLGELGEEQMAELLDECSISPWDPARFPADHWRILMADGALLRVVDEGKLRSAPADHFDHLLLAHCSSAWVKWYRVVGGAMGDGWEAGHRVDSSFLFWRLRELIEQGEVACDGRLPRHEEGSVDATKVRRAR